VILGFNLALARLDHRRRSKQAAVDELRDVTLADQPHEITLHAGDLLALLDAELCRNRSLSRRSLGLCLHSLLGNRSSCSLNGLGRLGGFGHRDAQEALGQFAGTNHRMSLDEGNECVDALGKGLAGNTELALHGTHVGDALGALLEDRETFAAQTTPEGVRGIKRETTLTLEGPFDGTADLPLGEGLDQSTM